jgi:hypothetical protein
MFVKTVWSAVSGKGFTSLTAAKVLFLVFDADPKVSRHDRTIGANGEFSELDLLFTAIQHAGVYQAKVWGAPKFFTVKIHSLLDFYTQCSAGVIVKP